MKGGLSKSMLGHILKELREKKKVTQDDMAKLLNIKRQSYSAYERGLSSPNAAALLVIANFFNVSIDYLLENQATASKMISSEVDFLSIVDRLTIEEDKKSATALIEQSHNQSKNDNASTLSTRDEEYYLYLIKSLTEVERLKLIDYAELLRNARKQ